MTTIYNQADESYAAFARTILADGVTMPNRTGISTRSVSGLMAKYDLQQGFPLLTTKRVHWKSVVYELLWFLRGDSNIKWLTDHGVTIWNEWADSEGELGPVYGVQWMRWRTTAGSIINQVEDAVNLIRKSPNSRRILVSAWNPQDIPSMRLPPCHVLYQFNVDTVNNKLHLCFYMRSLDTFLGCPFNVASYALLLAMVAHITGYTPGVVTHFASDAHFYVNHLDQINEQLQRTSFAPPSVQFDSDVKEISQFTFDSIKLVGYQSHPPIKAAVAV